MKARWACELLLLGAVWSLVLLCPLTKVEESFNMQATHDLLTLGPLPDALRFYDHFTFSGVVPRTFVGAVALAAAAAPVHFPLHLLGAPLFWSQVVVRLVLGTAAWLCFRCFNAAVARRFGAAAATGTALVTALQFHLPFYMSRTLPNTLALLPALLAYAQWLNGKSARALALLSFATAVFRCDLVVLLAPLALQMLLTGSVSFVDGVKAGITGGLMGILLSASIDTYFWGRLLWPEGQVLLFNTVENRSSEWGTQPPQWYFSSALPRALSATGLLLLPAVLIKQQRKAAETLPDSALNAPVAAAATLEPGKEPAVVPVVKPSLFARLVDADALLLALPTVAFAALYSALPHKELRFLLPGLPLLNAAAGIGAAKLVRAASARGKKGSPPLAVRASLLLAVAIAFAATAATTVLLAAASRENYPGGRALLRLHASLGKSGAAPGSWWARQFNSTVAAPFASCSGGGASSGSRCIGNDNHTAAMTASGAAAAAAGAAAGGGGGMAAAIAPGAIAHKAPPLVHIDAEAAMTGITRFLEVPGVSYSRAENLTEFSRFDYLVMGAASHDRHPRRGFAVAEAVRGFAGLKWERCVAVKPREDALGDVLTVKLPGVRRQLQLPLPEPLRSLPWDRIRLPVLAREPRVVILRRKHAAGTAAAAAANKNVDPADQHLLSAAAMFHK